MPDDDSTDLLIVVGDALVDAALHPGSTTSPSLAAMSDAIQTAALPARAVVVGLAALRAVERRTARVAPDVTMEKVVAGAQAMCRPVEAPAMRQLGAAALLHLAVGADPSMAVRRLVYAATTAIAVGRSDLAAETARLATRLIDSGGHEAEPVDLVEALAVLAAAGDQNAYERAVRLANDLSENGHDVIVRDRVAGLRPPGGGRPRQDKIADAADFFGDGDVASAAATLDEVLSSLDVVADDDLLGGLRAVLRQLRSAEPDPEAIREGMQVVVSHLRRRQVLGAVPPYAVAALRLALHFLLRRPIAEQAELVTEAVDAVLDAGLSDLPNTEFGWRGPPELAARLAEATITSQAAHSLQWRRTADLLTAAGGGDALILYCTDTRPDRVVVASIYVPDDHKAAFRERALSGRSLAALRRFASFDRFTIAAITDASIRALADDLLPPMLIERLSAGAIQTLSVVPHDQLWAVPWPALLATIEAASPCPTVVLPSLSMGTRLARHRPSDGRIVVAADPSLGVSDLLDERHEGVDESGVVRWHMASSRAELSKALEEPASVLVLVGHGSGRGLAFEMTLGKESIRLGEIFRREPTSVVVVASCWSGRRPARPVPLGIATAGLLAGSRAVIAGLWDVPARPTIDMAFTVAAECAQGASAANALVSAQGPWSHRHPVNWAGLVAFGSPT